MPAVSDFLAAIEAIRAEAPTYREGGSGTDGTCDCVGLLMGALRRCGHGKFPLHSSNYFARCEMQHLRALYGAGDLEIGEAVYKATADPSDLNARYQPGGRYYTGDPLDYYHIGVVTGVHPLRITHCTGPGVIVDSALGKWSHAGRIKGIDYTASMAENKDVTKMQQATVTAPSGTTVNLRERPNENAPVLARVPIGTGVDVEEQAEGWARVVYGDVRGYMMSKFLVVEADAAAEPYASEAFATLTLTLTAEQAQTLLAIAEQIGGMAV